LYALSFGVKEKFCVKEILLYKARLHLPRLDPKGSAKSRVGVKRSIGVGPQ
jgi:hypothetical protein